MYEKEKAELIKKALTLVDNLANLDVDEDIDEIEELINKAKKLKKSSLWRLK